MIDLGAKGEVEHHLGGAAIKLLRELEERALAEFLAVGGTPDGEFERFLLDLIGDGERAEEGGRDGFGDVERRPSPLDSSLLPGGISRNSRGTVEFPSRFGASVTQ